MFVESQYANNAFPFQYEFRKELFCISYLLLIYIK